MVAEISQYIGNGLRLRPAEAEAMYAGIMIDTNYFTDKAGVRTFEAMAYLRRSGADVVRVRKLFREDINEYKIKAAAIQDTDVIWVSMPLLKVWLKGWKARRYLVQRLQIHFWILMV